MSCPHVEAGLETEPIHRGPATSEAVPKSECRSLCGIHGFTHSPWRCKLSVPTDPQSRILVIPWLERVPLQAL